MKFPSERCTEHTCTWSVYICCGGECWTGVGGAKGVPGAKLSYGRGRVGGTGRGPPLTTSPREQLTLFTLTRDGEKRAGRGDEGLWV